jgi:hypothetical protein
VLTKCVLVGLLRPPRGDRTTLAWCLHVSITFIVLPCGLSSRKNYWATSTSKVEAGEKVVTLDCEYIDKW